MLPVVNPVRQFLLLHPMPRYLLINFIIGICLGVRVGRRKIVINHLLVLSINNLCAKTLFVRRWRLAYGSSGLTVCVDVSLRSLQSYSCIIFHSASKANWWLLLIRVFLSFFTPHFIASLAALEPTASMISEAILEAARATLRMHCILRQGQIVVNVYLILRQLEFN